MFTVRNVCLYLLPIFELLLTIISVLNLRQAVLLDQTEAGKSRWVFGLSNTHDKDPFSSSFSPLTHSLTAEIPVNMKYVACGSISVEPRCLIHVGMPDDLQNLARVDKKSQPQPSARVL